MATAGFLRLSSLSADTSLTKPRLATDKNPAGGHIKGRHTRFAKSPLMGRKPGCVLPWLPRLSKHKRQPGSDVRRSASATVCPELPSHFPRVAGFWLGLRIYLSRC